VNSVYADVMAVSEIIPFKKAVNLKPITIDNDIYTMFHVLYLVIEVFYSKKICAMCPGEPGQEMKSREVRMCINY
jgi:hypothetical protein